MAGVRYRYRILTGREALKVRTEKARSAPTAASPAAVVAALTEVAVRNAGADLLWTVRVGAGALARDR